MRKADNQGRTLFTLSWELTPGHLLETESNHFIISYLFQLPFFELDLIYNISFRCTIQ